MLKKLTIALFSIWLSGLANAQNLTDFYGNPLPIEEQQKIEQEVQKLEIRANQGDIEALSEVTQFYLYTGNEPKTIYWVNKMTENGYPEAVMILAGAYNHGFYGFAQSSDKAFYYSKAANLGDVYSQLWLVDYYLGTRWIEGGVCNCGEIDYQKALEWARKASALGSARANQKIAEIYLYRDENPDYEKVIEYHKLAVKQSKSQLQEQPTDGSAELELVWSYTDLGEIYYQLKDYQQAKTNFENAIDVADYHSSRAYYGLSFMYRNGDGVPKDVNKADEFHKKSCELGYVPACENQ